MNDPNTTSVAVATTPGRPSGFRGQLANLLGPALRQRFAIYMSARSLRAARRRCRTVAELCQLTFDWQGYGGCWTIKSLQDLQEMVPYFELVAARRPRVCMEIGTCYGGTLFPLFALAADDAHVVSIDLPGGIHGGGSTAIHANLFVRAFPTGHQRLDLIRDDSHLEATRDRAKALLGEAKLDYLFIDGDHRYEGVKKDFLLYAPLVRRGGLIAFHDISEKAQPGVEVHRLWGRLKQLLPTTEFINHARGYELLVGGIGVIPHWDPSVLDRVESEAGVLA